VGADFLDVNGRDNNFDVVERKLGTLSDDFAVERDEGASVVVESITVAALLICVEVDAAGLELAGILLRPEGKGSGRRGAADLERGFLDEVNTGRELAKLVVAAARVSEDFNTVESHVDVGPVNESLVSNLLEKARSEGSTNALGVNSSSHISTPIHVSRVDTTASPKGTVVCVSEIASVSPVRSSAGSASGALSSLQLAAAFTPQTSSSDAHNLPDPSHVRPSSATKTPL
jgi:hypothetical protein